MRGKAMFIIFSDLGSASTSKFKRWTVSTYLITHLTRLIDSQKMFGQIYVYYECHIKVCFI